ncbi:hypothetical protein ABZW18_20405 [Streptomyces sp. NPDC004647]|uniref:hypothetical protein n=1 Tax=Streptomyces sp. NPDC004647 TaxID=3154671 RepID=UPI0033B221F4
MSGETARKPSEKRRGESKPAWGWRIVGLLLGLAITLVGAGAVIVNSVQGVQATGLVGTRGTFTVDYCYETSSGKWPDYKCRGTFAPRAAESADRRGPLENAENYPAGEKLDVVEGSVGAEGYFRETGVGATLGSVMWLCFGLVFLLWGVLTSRKWAKSFKK